MSYRTLGLLVLAWCLACPVAASEQSGLPWHLLGRHLSEIESLFLETVYDSVFDDEIFNGMEDERLFVIDNDRRYLTLHTVDRVVTEVIVTDELYVTARGVSVGDTLSKVRSAYPEAFDQARRLGRFQGSGYHATESPGRTRFSFSSAELYERWMEGESIGFDDEAVDRARLWLIHMRAK